MERIIGKIGNKAIFILLFLLFPISSISAKKSEIQNSEYIVSWNFQDEFFENYDVNELWIGDKKFKFDKTYRLFNKNPVLPTQIAISNGMTTLFYDIIELKQFSPIYNEMSTKIMFHKIDNGIDMVIYVCLNEGIDNLFAKAFVINFDFLSNTVILKDFVDISYFIADFINEYGHHCFLSNIYQLYFCQNINLQDLIFNQGGDDSCAKRSITPTSFVNNVFISDLTQDYKFLRKSSDLIGKTPRKILSDKEIVNDLIIRINKYSISSKSFLKEGSTSYISSNLTRFSDTPWVPSIDYKEELLTIKSDEKIAALNICNGFFKSDRDDLYIKNCRVKEIEIIYPKNYGFTHRVILNDTGYPQFIPLINNNCNEVKIKILSVYEGSCYSDVCINCIYPVSQYDEQYYFDNYCGM